MAQLQIWKWERQRSCGDKGVSLVQLGNEGDGHRPPLQEVLLRGHEVGAIEAGPFAVGAFFVEEIEHPVGGNEDALGHFVGADDGLTATGTLDVLDGDFPDFIDFLAEGLAFIDGERGLVADHDGHDSLGELDPGDAEDLDGVAAGELEGGVFGEGWWGRLRVGGSHEDRGEGQKGGEQGTSIHKSW